MTEAVVVHHPQGTRPPLVFVHTWDTDRDNLAALADFLGPDHPLYGIEPPDPPAGPMPEHYDHHVTLFTGDENRASAAGDPSLR